MPIEAMPLPSSRAIQNHIRVALSRYWPQHSLDFDIIPVVEAQLPTIHGPLKLRTIQLPDWAVHLGIEDKILVPEESCVGGDDWQQVDWWLAAFLLLECWHERTWELQHGPIHSYSFCLKGWDTRAWDHAWVNRIALFLKAWLVQQVLTKADPVSLSLPEPEFVMTHDVDAVSKTIPIRLKQGVFNLFNAGRLMYKGDMCQAINRVGKAVKFMFCNEDWWTLDRLIEQERKAGIHSHFNFFADRRNKTLKRWLFDPSYDLFAPRLSRLIRKIQREGGTIGLHSTYDAWQDTALIDAQRKNVEMVAGAEVQTCRQHWLRFSWNHTWTAQQQAGIRLDTTLMFNDRPGFRASAAMQWQPWNPSTQSAHSLQVLPTVLMDSHVYDYQSMGDSTRQSYMHSWLEEIRQVYGQAALLWHPHTLTRDYGWQLGFDELLAGMK